MNTTCTVVVDNIAEGDLQGEWGLCIYIEYGEHRILLDAGSSSLFADNLAKLHLDIRGIDAAVLSHAHFDHANGMPTFFEHNPEAKFYLREGSGENCYFKKFIFHKYIGIPRHVLRDYPDRIVFASGDYQLYDGVWLIPHKTANLEQIGKREMMWRKTPKGWKPDDYSHEQSLVLDTDKGLVIFNSCSHGGAVNIIHEVQATFPDKHIYGLVGGLHLFNKSTEEIEATARAIRETGIDYVCTGHCTKNRAYGIMKNELGDKLEQLHVGLKMKF